MIKVYTKDNCMQCKMTETRLRVNNIEFEEINLSQVSNADEIRVQLRDQGFQATPVVVTEKETWAGFRPDKINALSN